MTTHGATEQAKPFGRKDLGAVQLEWSSVGTLALRGKVSDHDPAGLLTAHFKEVHRVMESNGLDVLNVDVRELSYVNSSAIRVFIDWVAWIQKGARPYRLCFVTDRSVTWQRLSFSALETIAGDVVKVQASAPVR